MQDLQTRKKSKKKLVLLTIGLLFLLVLYFSTKQLSISNNFHIRDQKQTQQPATNELYITPTEKTKLKVFTADEFRNLYQSYVFPNTRKISEDTAITSSTELDIKIKKLAADRGYKIRSAPIVDAFVSISPEYKLQQKAYKDYVDFREASVKAGVPIELTAAYRSAEDQKNIFLSRLGSTNPSDEQIIKTLETTAPPGYSRHHTGYTIDIACTNNKYQQFHTTPCFSWISADNYTNAKKHGWIPSYPEGTGKQGPEPEAWEYVWVGKDATYE